MCLTPAVSCGGSGCDAELLRGLGRGDPATTLGLQILTLLWVTVVGDSLNASSRYRTVSTLSRSVKAVPSFLNPLACSVLLAPTPLPGLGCSLLSLQYPSIVLSDPLSTPSRIRVRFPRVWHPPLQLPSFRILSGPKYLPCLQLLEPLNQSSPDST